MNTQTQGWIYRGMEYQKSTGHFRGPVDTRVGVLPPKMISCVTLGKLFSGLFSWVITRRD